MNNTITTEQAKAGFAVMKAVAETIRECASDREIPTGPMYAMLTGKLSLSAFQSILGSLERAGLIRQNGCMVKWVGPKI